MALRLMHAMVLAALAGCSSISDGGPVAWWHQLQGGRLADERPAPPRADAPYPNLATVPSRPTVDDAAQRGRIAAGLVADRANAQYGAGSPLPPLPARAPVPPAAPAGDMGASLAAASREPVTPTAAPPRRAPVSKVEAAPLTPPATAAAAASPPAPDTPLPDIPAAAPQPPSLDGVRQATAPAPPPVAPPPAPVIAPLPQGAPVAVAFSDGSAQLPDAARSQLRTLAERRAGRQILVAGYGSAAEGDTAGQSRALPLAWERAGAISGALQAAGVPANALSVSARATGQGGVARIAE